MKKDRVENTAQGAPIYLDHAATTRLDGEVFEAMKPYFSEGYGNADSPHRFGREAMNGVDFARDKIAELLHAKPSEIYFTSGGTESDNWAVLGAARAQKAKGKTRVILSKIEHHAVLAAGEKLQTEGFDVQWLGVNEGGRVELDELNALLNEQTALVGIMAVNNETGVIQPIEACAKMAHERGALFFTDGVQALPFLPVDVQKWGVDLLAFSAHKFHGPKGVGGLFVKSGVKLEKLIGGGEQERGLRGGTTNVPAVVGMAKAYKKTVENLTAKSERIEALSQTFLRVVQSQIPDVKPIGDRTHALAGILNLSFPDVNNVDFVYAMDLKGVAVSAGAACASASIKPSHVLLAMGMSEAEAKTCARFSFGDGNTEEEIGRAAAITTEIVKRLRG